MNEIFGDVISAYSQQEAIDDGVLVLLTKIAGQNIVATSNCFHQLGLKEPFKALLVIKDAIRALLTADDEDTDSMKLRTLYDGDTRFWVVYDGNGVCIMMPEDY